MAYRAPPPAAGPGGTGSGGGLYNSGRIQMAECAFVDNSAQGGGGAAKEFFSFHQHSALAATPMVAPFAIPTRRN